MLLIPPIHWCYKHKENLGNVIIGATCLHICTTNTLVCRFSAKLGFLVNFFNTTVDNFTGRQFYRDGWGVQRRILGVNEQRCGRAKPKSINASIFIISFLKHVVCLVLADRKGHSNAQPPGSRGILKLLFFYSTL